MKKLMLVWLINTGALFAVPMLMSSVKINNLAVAFLAAAVMGLVNALLKPLLILLTLPVTILSLGLFLLIVNGLMFWLVAGLVPGFQVAGFWSAIGGAILFSIISWALSALFLEDK